MLEQPPSRVKSALAIRPGWAGLGEVVWGALEVLADGGQAIAGDQTRFSN